MADLSILQSLSRELEGLVARCAACVVGVEHRRGHGTGFVLTEDGYVLTNAHVVQRARRHVDITLSADQRAAALIVGRDADSDLAVLKVDPAAIQGRGRLKLAEPESVRVGQLVLAIGNPLNFERSVSMGVVSALERALPRGRGQGSFEGLIQTDAAINPGNSGGPLVNVSGDVVGINTAIVPRAQGLGFALPSQTAEWVASVLIQHGEVRRPKLGIMARGVELTAALAEDVGQSRALRIEQVAPNTPADRAGLSSGDLVIAAEGQAVGRVDDLQRAMVFNAFSEITLTVWREGKELSVAASPRSA